MQLLVAPQHLGLVLELDELAQQVDFAGEVVELADFGPGAFFAGELQACGLDHAGEGFFAGGVDVIGLDVEEYSR